MRNHHQRRSLYCAACGPQSSDGDCDRYIECGSDKIRHGYCDGIARDRGHRLSGECECPDRGSAGVHRNRDRKHQPCRDVEPVRIRVYRHRLRNDQQQRPLHRARQHSESTECCDHRHIASGSNQVWNSDCNRGCPNHRVGFASHGAGLRGSSAAVHGHGFRNIEYSGDLEFERYRLHRANLRKHHQHRPVYRTEFRARSAHGHRDGDFAGGSHQVGNRDCDGSAARRG